MIWKIYIWKRVDGFGRVSVLSKCRPVRLDNLADNLADTCLKITSACLVWEALA